MSDTTAVIIRAVIVAIVTALSVVAAHYHIITDQVATGAVSAVVGWAIGHTVGQRRGNGGGK